LINLTNFYVIKTKGKILLGKLFIVMFKEIK